MSKITIDRSVLESWVDAMQCKGMAEGRVTIAAREMREALAQPMQEPAWWPAVENILNEYGLQAIDFVADFNAAIEQTQQEPVAIVVAREYEDGSPAGHCLEWRGRNEADDFPVGTKFYTSPPARKPLTDDSDRLDWLMRMISGVEFRRIGVYCAGNVNREDIDSAIEAANGIKP